MDPSVFESEGAAVSKKNSPGFSLIEAAGLGTAKRAGRVVIGNPSLKARQGGGAMTPIAPHSHGGGGEPESRIIPSQRMVLRGKVNLARDRLLRFRLAPAAIHYSTIFCAIVPFERNLMFSNSTASEKAIEKYT